MAVLLVEQNARLALEICPRAYVLEAADHAIGKPLSGALAAVRRVLGAAMDEPRRARGARLPAAGSGV